MKTINLFILASILSIFTCCNSSSQQKIEISKNTNFNFDNYQPENWEIALTGNGKMCNWKLINDNNNMVLAQISNEKPDYRFNLIINKKLYYKDVEIALKFNGIDGEGDQGGGPVWHYIDNNNYYVARANPLENNFRLYKVINGDRIELKSANIKINSKQWYQIKIIMKGDKIQCYFNNKLELETTDNTFPTAGKIGLWTKSDAVTYFDDLNIKAIK